MRWMWYGLGAMFVLIGVAIILAIYYGRTTPEGYPYGFGWLWGFIWIPFAFFWIFGWGWRGYRYRRYRYDDGAYQILRERYARGEITKEQFEQMMRDLEQR
jgi:putative membrane protein